MADNGSDPISGTEWTSAEKKDAAQFCRAGDRSCDESFHQIVRHAAKICGASIAVIALSDGSSVGIIAQQGLGSEVSAGEAERIRAYLSETIGKLPDGGKDSSVYPILANLGFESYAGRDLKTTDGYPVGTLAVLDRRRRVLNDDQLDVLEFLASQTMALLEHRQAAARYQQQLQVMSREIRIGQKFEAVVAQSPEFIAAVDLQGFVFFMNEVASEMTGLRIKPPVAYEMKELVAAEQLDTFLGEVMPVILQGEVCERRLRLHNVRTRETIPTLFTMFPVRNADRKIIFYCVGSKDVAALEAEEERRDHLIREGVHRIRNAVTLVNSIVNQTLRSKDNIQDAQAAIWKRLEAFGAAQAVLGTTSSADIWDVVRVALNPYDGGEGRFRISGPAVELNAEQAQGISLGLYELATNAVKYGSLSNDVGTVTVEWNLSEDGAFALRWVEADGPAVSQPTSKGFGSTLVTRGIGSYFSGEVIQEFEPEGVKVILRGRLKP